MMTMPKCHDCGKFCHPVEWKMIYSGALLEPQEEIYKCATCTKKNGSFAPQHGIKPEYSCGKFPAVPPAPTFADGMTAAHGVTLESGDVVLSARLIERIFLAMDAAR